MFLVNKEKESSLRRWRSNKSNWLLFNNDFDSSI